MKDKGKLLIAMIELTRQELDIIIEDCCTVMEFSPPDWDKVDADDLADVEARISLWKKCLLAKPSS
jgi:RecA-family ATPase